MSVHKFASRVETVVGFLYLRCTKVINGMSWLKVVEHFLTVFDTNKRINYSLKLNLISPARLKVQFLY